MQVPTIAITNQVFSSIDELLRFCSEHDCQAVEYTFSRAAMSTEDIRREIPDIEKLLQAGITLRYHLAFKGRDLGDTDPGAAREALLLYGYCVRLAAELGGDHAVLHIGLGKKESDVVDYSSAALLLKELVPLGHENGVRVCLENLRRGRTGDPEGLWSLLQTSGAWATLDVGHAMAAQAANGGDGHALEFIRLCKDRILSAHVYEIEKRPENGASAIHFPPHNLDNIRPLLDGLLEHTRCAWWLIELVRRDEVEHTLGLLRSYLAGVQDPCPGSHTPRNI